MMIDKGGQPTFLLIHGAWHGGWCWGRVADRLRAAGHRVLTPTLTGLGERAHLTAHGGVSCSTHVQDILNVVHYEQVDDIILCGHSYGGIVTGVVADRLADKVRAVVFLDSIVPEDGKSFLDQVGSPDYIAYLVSQLQDQGANLPAFSAESFAVRNAEDRAFVDSLCTPQAFATFAERMALSGAQERIATKLHVLATDWENSPFGPHHERAKELPGWTTTTIEAGHELMIDEPDAVAAMLLALAPTGLGRPPAPIAGVVSGTDHPVDED